MADSQAPMIRKVVRYRGHVQGVGFRFNAVRQAHGLQVVGFVRNEANGDVLLDAQGPKSDVQELLKRIARSMSDRIDEALVTDRDLIEGRTRFDVTY